MNKQKKHYQRHPQWTNTSLEGSSDPEDSIDGQVPPEWETLSQPDWDELHGVFTEKLLPGLRNCIEKPETAPRFLQAKEAKEGDFALWIEGTHAGYFGPYGENVLEDWIYETLLTDMIHQERFTPLTVSEFAYYILMPLTAVVLISEQNGLTHQAAYDVWERSKDYGETFRPDEGSEYDAAEDRTLSGSNSTDSDLDSGLDEVLSKAYLKILKKDHVKGMNAQWLEGYKKYRNKEGEHDDEGADDEEDEHDETMKEPQNDDPNDPNETINQEVPYQGKGKGKEKQLTSSTGDPKPVFESKGAQKRYERELAIVDHPEVVKGEKMGWPLALPNLQERKRFQTIQPKIEKICKDPQRCVLFKDLLRGLPEQERTKSALMEAGLINEHNGFYGPAHTSRFRKWIEEFIGLDKINMDAIAPLSRDNYLFKIVVPTTAIYMIQAYLKLKNVEDATEVWKASREFGEIAHDDEPIYTSSDDDSSDQSGSE